MNMRPINRRRFNGVLVAGAAPLYGMCTMLVCVIDFSNSVVRLTADPLPLEP